MQTYPPIDVPVIVTMADGTEFEACRIVVEGEEGSCSVWGTAHEIEPNMPDCWTDGICWGSNDAGKPSEKPIQWRYKK